MKIAHLRFPFPASSYGKDSFPLQQQPMASRALDPHSQDLPGSGRARKDGFEAGKRIWVRDDPENNGEFSSARCQRPFEVSITSFGIDFSLKISLLLPSQEPGFLLTGSLAWEFRGCAVQNFHNLPWIWVPGNGATPAPQMSVPISCCCTGCELGFAPAGAWVPGPGGFSWQGMEFRR